MSTRVDSAVGKPAEPGGGALPPLHRRAIFEHMFDAL
jgi:hypothetical protein